MTCQLPPVALGRRLGGPAATGRRGGAIERMIRESETTDQIAGATAREAAKPAARRRLRTLIADPIQAVIEVV
jgi:hypothetical protein